MKLHKKYIIGQMLLTLAVTPAFAADTDPLDDLDLTMDIIEETVETEKGAAHTIELPEPMQNRYQERVRNRHQKRIQHRLIGETDSTDREDQMADREDQMAERDDNRENARNDRDDNRNGRMMGRN